MIRRIGLPFGASDITPYLATPAPKRCRRDAPHGVPECCEGSGDSIAPVCRAPSGPCRRYLPSEQRLGLLWLQSRRRPHQPRDRGHAHDPVDPSGGRSRTETLSAESWHTYEKLGRHAQVSVLIGDHLGDLQTLVDRYLPKPAIDRTTIRMAELLKARWGAGQARRHCGCQGSGNRGRLCAMSQAPFRAGGGSSHRHSGLRLARRDQGSPRYRSAGVSCAQRGLSTPISEGQWIPVDPGR